MQQMHTIVRAEGVRSGQTVDRWAGTDCAGAHDQRVIRQFRGRPGRVEDVEGVLGDVDSGGAGIGEHPHAGGGQVISGAMREVGPVRDLPGDVVGDAADGEVGVGVGDDHGDLGAGVEFADAQGGADSGVAAADGDDMACGHDEVSSMCRVEKGGVLPRCSVKASYMSGGGVGERVV